MAMVKTWWVVFLCSARHISADDVVALKAASFNQHIQDNKQTLVEFYAPWCGHCKKLTPEYEKAAGELKSKGVLLAKVDATEEKDLASKYNVKGFPTMVWFEDGKEAEYDGGRTSEAIVDWVMSMTGAAVSTSEPAPPPGDKPRVVLQAESLLQGFEDAAKANRRKAAWYHQRVAGAPKVVVTHKGESPVELVEGCGDKAAVTRFLTDNLMPLFGKLDGDSFDKYMDAGKGLVWTLFPVEDGGIEGVEAKHRPMMEEVAQKVKQSYFVTYTDTEKFKEAIDNMLSVKTFPAISVQKKAGDKKKYTYTGDMDAERITKFIQDVDAGIIQPSLKSEPVPQETGEAVRVVVGSTFTKEVFLPDRDVLLEVYAPWCGHCKKLEPEYSKLAKKISKEQLTDLVTVAKIDGTANDSPVDSVEWSGFPTLFFVKAGSSEPVLYEGERTAKGLWKYIKKHATKAEEMRERLEKRKSSGKKGGEL